VSDYVVDTNVWAIIDQDLATFKTKEEVFCQIACRDWLKTLVESDDRLVIDLVKQTIIREYRRNIPKGGVAHQYLNQLETQPREKRLVEVEIQYDENECGVLQFNLPDEDDRKFAAVALAHTPTPPIIDATDTDWEKEKAVLLENGLRVTEVCAAYIEKKLAGK
jgi:hypothetical protein